MSELDVPLLRKTLEWALEEHWKAERGEPSEWDQGEWLTSQAQSQRRWFNAHGNTWVEATQKVAKMDLPDACGTACCIAGKITMDAGLRPRSTTISVATAFVINEDGDDEFVGTAAMRLLGGNPSRLEELFSGGNDIIDLFVIAGRLTDGEIEMPTALIEKYEWRPSE